MIVSATPTRRAPPCILAAMAGPEVRTDIIDVYVFRIPASRIADTEFLQMRRVSGPLAGTWQPVMGHVETGESAQATAIRELNEETGYCKNRGLVGLWQLESVNTYFLASKNCVMMSPCFAAHVATDIAPRLDPAHDAHRWIKRDQADRLFLWPGQRAAIDPIVRDILPAAARGQDEADTEISAAGFLRIDPTQW